MKCTLKWGYLFIAFKKVFEFGDEIIDSNFCLKNISDPFHDMTVTQQVLDTGIFEAPS
jgi:hypothetical protein